VILLSFHGTASNSVVFRVLARRLGSPRIQTITPDLPHKISSFHDIQRSNIPATSAAWLYAEVAYHGQQLLQQGAVIHIAGDTFARGPGVTHRFLVGDREYRVKPGFAQLALNTGAAIIPVNARFLEDGRLHTHLHAPLEPGPGPREEQVARLVRQYGLFMNDVFHTHPEALRWKKIANHLHPYRTPAEEEEED
jgi:hypothetical protein